MTKFSVSLKLLLLLTTFCSGQKIDSRCTSSVCADWYSKNECPTLDKDCLENGQIFKFPVECGCCDYCIKYLEADAWCDIGQPGQPTPGSICGSGLGCTRVEGQEHAMCKRLDTACHAAQDQYDKDKEEGILGHLRQRPSCDEYGNYAPAICIPGSICYCVNTDGGRIFGEKTFENPELQRTMSCTCSRDAWRSSRLRLGDDAVFAHCLSDGSYDPLQCVDNICTCVDNEGIPDDTKIHVELLNDTSPHCFNSSELGHVSGVWSRECEASRSDLLARQRDAVKFGANVVFSDMPNCGLDGNYDRLRKIGEMLVCTGPDGKMIEEYQISRYSAEAKKMDCNCARTRDTLRRSAASSELSPTLPDCCPNGNFKAWQCSRGLCYCADDNGNQLYNEVRESEVSTLSCFVDLSGNPCPATSS